MAPVCTSSFLLESVNFRQRGRKFKSLEDIENTHKSITAPTTHVYRDYFIKMYKDDASQQSSQMASLLKDTRHRQEKGLTDVSEI